MSVLEELNGNITEYEYQKQQERKRERKRKHDAKIIQALEDVREQVDLRMKAFENVVEESTYASTRDTYMDKANVCHEIIKIIDRKIKEIENES